MTKVLLDYPTDPKLHSGHELRCKLIKKEVAVCSLDEKSIFYLTDLYSVAFYKVGVDLSQAKRVVLKAILEMKTQSETRVSSCANSIRFLEDEMDVFKVRISFSIFRGKFKEKPPLPRLILLLNIWSLRII